LLRLSRPIVPGSAAKATDVDRGQSRQASTKTPSTAWSSAKPSPNAWRSWQPIRRSRGWGRRWCG